jgi:hypothetical protein
LPELRQYCLHDIGVEYEKRIRRGINRSQLGGNVVNKDLEKYTSMVGSLRLPDESLSDQFQDLILCNIVYTDSKLEQLYVSQEGDSHTRKLSNLRFELDKLLETVLETAANIWKANPVAIVLNVLLFIKEVYKLSDMPVSKNDATVLIAIWLIQREKSQDTLPTNDDLRAYLKDDVSEKDLETSLEALTKFRCIKRTSDGEIRLIEEIEFPD